MTAESDAAKQIAALTGIPSSVIFLWAAKHGVCLRDLCRYLQTAPEYRLRVFEEAILNDLPFHYERKERHD